MKLTFSSGKFIFKEDDDISMDMTVMFVFIPSSFYPFFSPSSLLKTNKQHRDLLRLANKVWEKAGCEARILTYTVVATANLSGFCEVIILIILSVAIEDRESFY